MKCGPREKKFGRRKNLFKIVVKIGKKLFFDKRFFLKRSFLRNKNLKKRRKKFGTIKKKKMVIWILI